MLHYQMAYISAYIDRHCTDTAECNAMPVASLLSNHVDKNNAKALVNISRQGL
jgi:hypothetical protein